MSRSMHALQGEPLPYNHHLHQFLTFLKHERGFADATIVNRKRSLKPFLAWVIAQDVQLSAVSPVTITKYFTSAVAGRWKRTSVSFHVQSLRSFFRYASSRGWCAAGIAESIDAPRLYTYENLPQGPSWEEVGKLLASVDGTSPVQIRSRCAILLCAVYGSGFCGFCRVWLKIAQAHVFSCMQHELECLGRVNIFGPIEFEGCQSEKVLQFAMLPDVNPEANQLDPMRIEAARMTNLPCQSASA